MWKMMMSEGLNIGEKPIYSHDSAERMVDLVTATQ